MKNKYLLLFLISSFLLCGCNEQNKYLFLGSNILLEEKNFIDLLKDEIKKEVDNSFIYENFIIKDLYRDLDSDAINLKSKSSLNKKIKNKYQIILNIGNYQLLRLLDYKNEFKFNEEEIENDQEMFEYYLEHIFEIFTTYENNVFVIPMFNYIKLDDTNNIQYERIIKEYNAITHSLCDEYNYSYIDIDDMKNYIIRDECLSQKGGEVIISQIKDAIN